MLSDKLKSREYYKNKLPLYMQNSYGILEHFDILYNILINLDLNEEAILELFEIMSPNYENIITKYDSLTGNSFKFLDIIGNFFGVQRNFNVNLNGTEKSLSLNNSELLKLIKVQVIKNNFDGSYEQLSEFYNSINLPIYFLLDTVSANVKLVIPDKYYHNGEIQITNLTQNELDMFNSGMFTVQSLGISYNYLKINLDLLAIWDSNDTNLVWDNALWS